MQSATDKTDKTDKAAESSADSKDQLRIFLWLLAAGFLGILVFSFATVTYTLPTIVETLSIDTSELPPNTILVLASTIQPTLLIALAIWGGLSLSKMMGVNVTPIITGGAGQRGVIFIVTGLAVGFVAGLMMLAAHQFIFLPITGVPINAVATYPFWLAIGTALLYGGIVEELLLRLGLMTLLLWAGTKIQPGRGLRPSNSIFWLTNFIVTIVFGLLHVVTAPVLLGIDITPLVIVQALVLNSVGLIFGWLYWQRGLESAIAAHMGVHLGYTLMAFLLF